MAGTHRLQSHGLKLERDWRNGLGERQADAGGRARRRRSIAWYDQKDTGLGDEFLKYVNKCIQSIERHPEMHPRVHRKMRRALLEVFPYQVIYEINPTEIIVFAIYHCARDPEGWKKRLPA